jgi:uncharacterized protein
MSRVNCLAKLQEKLRDAQRRKAARIFISVPNPMTLHRMVLQSSFEIPRLCSMTSQPLSDAELDRLSDLLSRFGAKGAMNLEQLDGFFAALIAGPDDVLPSEYLPEIWGDAMVNEDTFRAQAILQDFLSLVTRHWNAVSKTLRSGNVYTPLLLEDEHGVAHGNDWVNGFLGGMELRREDWNPLIDDEDNGGSLVPIFALAHEHDPDPELRPYDKPISPELREKLIIGVAAGVMRIYRYFEKRGQMASPALSSDATFRRLTPKIGRNDPCPCGSGKKYKYCCGKITMH